MSLGGHAVPADVNEVCERFPGTSAQGLHERFGVDSGCASGCAQERQQLGTKAVVDPDPVLLELVLECHEFVDRQLGERPIQPRGQRIYGPRLSVRRFVDHVLSLR